ncbi:MAG: hypothetical protein QXD43_04215 [Candidatus Aenigmatarchaeota archaeon]
MIKKILLIILIVFGLFYSFLISFYGGFYTGFIFVLITIGFASTIYLLDKKVSYRIVVYVWIAIIVIAAITLLLQWVFNIANLLKP